MAGIYLHIPFCKQACHYCNFHFSTSLEYKEELVNAICREIILQKNYLEGEKIDSIYFGGGTPSILSIDDCRLLMENIYDHYPVNAGAEITLEANPDDINEEKLNGWKSTGINRLSIGIQSFFEEELRWMNRAHSARQAKENLELALALFENITIDLIYGSPLLTDDMWEQNVRMAIGYGIPHLSCYALTVEEKTLLHKLIHQNKSQPVDNERQARQFLLLMVWLRDEGYEHYEVSNFAKPGQRSRHNSSYWKGEKYLGLGPSAHSYNGVQRQWNIAHNLRYIEAVNNEIIPAEAEVLTSANKLNEYIMISLRTIEGMDLEVVEKKWGTEKKELMEKLLQPFIFSKEIVQENNYIRLTDEGMLAADGIAGRLFI